MCVYIYIYIYISYGHRLPDGVRTNRVFTKGSYFHTCCDIMIKCALVATVYHTFILPHVAHVFL